MQIKNILLVEDERINVLAVQKGFSKVNNDSILTAFDTAEKALEYLRGNDTKPEIIMLDLNLPKMNGIDFLKIIKEDPILKQIPVIVLTTSENPAHKLNCFDLQVAGYFIKPIDYFDLISSVWNYWTKSELVQMD